MIQFINLRYKNILASGQTWVSIDLNRSSSTLILGKNGVGKTSVIEALHFGLFGKPYRKIVKGDIVNHKNGREAVVEITFKCDGSLIEIRRGIKPDIFEIKQDGVVLPMPAKAADYQAQLERILGFNQTVFNHVVTVGKTTYTPFMRLDTPKRRSFVESILSLLVFTKMNQCHTSKASVHRAKTLEIDSAITVTREKVAIRKRYIADLETDLERQKADAIRRDGEVIARLRKEVSDLAHRKETLDAVPVPVATVDPSEMMNIRVRISSHGVQLQQAETKLNALKGKNDSGTCIECGQPWVDTHREERIAAAEAIVQSTKNELKEMLHVKQGLEERLAADESENKKYMVAAGNELLHISILLPEKVRAIDEHEARNVVHDFTESETKIQDERNRLAGLEDLAEKLSQKKSDMQVTTEYNALVSSMLKDTGIKAAIIRKFVKVLNHAINGNLVSLGFPGRMTLDENFNDTIFANGFEAQTYDGFSEGEKQRIDLAVMLAWRDAARLHSGTFTNLLMFDEVLDGSLDPEGSELLVKMLASLRDTNLFVITHSPERVSDSIRSQIRFKKVDGFSVIDTSDT